MPKQYMPLSEWKTEVYLVLTMPMVVEVDKENCWVPAEYLNLSLRFIRDQAKNFSVVCNKLKTVGMVLVMLYTSTSF